MSNFDLLKSHIDQYTRKDGAVVAAHDDNRTAAAPMSHDDWAAKVQATHGNVDFKKDAKKGVVQAFSGTDHVGSHRFAQGGAAASSHIAPVADEAKVASGPAKGEVGHEEHQKYGAYFKKGDKVKDNYGKHHEVLSHIGPQVHTTGGSYHPTKLHRA